MFGKPNTPLLPLFISIGFRRLILDTLNPCHHTHSRNEETVETCQNANWMCVEGATPKNTNQPKRGSPYLTSVSLFKSDSALYVPRPGITNNTWKTHAYNPDDVCACAHRHKRRLVRMSFQIQRYRNVYWEGLTRQMFFCGIQDKYSIYYIQYMCVRVCVKER